MSNCRTPACAPYRRPSRRRRGLPALLSTIGSWFRRVRIRRQLRQRSKISPALLDDIGLTEQEIGTEAAGFFWHV